MKKLLTTALKVIKKIEEHGYEAYIVGGYVRDHLMGLDSNDVDICTNAKPKELIKIFEGAILPAEDYGSVTIYIKNNRFEITTFRREISYNDYRRPVEIEYIDDLKEDIMRRDFTINTICMDKNKKIIDYLNARQDLANHLIKPVGDANYKFSQDVLRILRAIRFATKLDFSLSDEIIDGINKNKHLLKKISYERKREELDKIFTSPNAKRGIDLLIELGLDKELELNNLKNVTNTESLIGIWAIIDPEENTYRFTNNEKELIKSVKEVLPLNNLDPYNLYKYGLYVNSIAGAIKNIPKKDITRSYNNLVIHSRKDLAISIPEILNCLSIEKGPFIKTIFKGIEKEVLYKKLKNNRKALLNYCVVNFTSEIL